MSLLVIFVLVGALVAGAIGRRQPRPRPGSVALRASIPMILVTCVALMVVSGVAKFRANEVRPGWCGWFPGIYCEDTPEARRQTAMYDMVSRVALILAAAGLVACAYVGGRRNSAGGRPPTLDAPPEPADEDPPSGHPAPSEDACDSTRDAG